MWYVVEGPNLDKIYLMSLTTRQRDLTLKAGYTVTDAEPLVWSPQSEERPSRPPIYPHQHQYDFNMRMQFESQGWFMQLMMRFLGEVPRIPRIN